MARQDLRAIVRYIGKDNPARAKVFGEQLRDKTEALTRHPEMGHKARPGLPGGVRELIVHPNYVVFYRIVNPARVIQIIRVKHAARQTP